MTRDEDLEIIFSRFGIIKSCEIIRDTKTGDSLNYAFIEFETEGACIEAYNKMNNVLIDDRRIKVDFSQSVSHLWNRFLLQPRKKDGKKPFKQPPPPAPTPVQGKVGEVPAKRPEEAPRRMRHDSRDRDRDRERDRLHHDHRPRRERDESRGRHHRHDRDRSRSRDRDKDRRR